MDEIILVYIHNNFFDMAVLQWGHLFGNHNDALHFRNVINYPEKFKAKILADYDISSDEWHDYWEEMKTYRDKAVSHLEPSPKLKVPDFDFTYKCVSRYYSEIVGELKGFGAAYNLFPDGLDTYCGNREIKYGECGNKIFASLEQKT